jgi:hypothetical protein
MTLLASLYLKNDDIDQAFNWSKRALNSDHAQAHALANLFLNKADLERYDQVARFIVNANHNIT